MPAPKKPVFEKLRRLRQERGWTQEVLAEKAGVDQGTVSSMELGQIKSPSFDVVTRLAKALGVDAEDIIATTTRRTATAR